MSARSRVATATLGRQYRLMAADPLRRWDEKRRAALAAERQRQKSVAIEERLRETIAWSATLLADDLRRRGPSKERPLPVGLGARGS